MPGRGEKLSCAGPGWVGRTAGSAILARCNCSMAWLKKKLGRQRMQPWRSAETAAAPKPPWEETAGHEREPGYEVAAAHSLFLLFEVAAAHSLLLLFEVAATHSLFYCLRWPPHIPFFYCLRWQSLPPHIPFFLLFEALGELTVCPHPPPAPRAGSLFRGTRQDALKVKCGDPAACAIALPCLPPSPTVCVARVVAAHLHGDEIHPVEGVAAAVVRFAAQFSQQPIGHKLNVLRGGGEGKLHRRKLRACAMRKASGDGVGMGCDTGRCVHAPW